MRNQRQAQLKPVGGGFGVPARAHPTFPQIRGGPEGSHLGVGRGALILSLREQGRPSVRVPHVLQNFNLSAGCRLSQVRPLTQPCLGQTHWALLGHVVRCPGDTLADAATPFKKNLPRPLDIEKDRFSTRSRRDSECPPANQWGRTLSLHRA